MNTLDPRYTKVFYGMFFSLAIPIILSQLLSTGLVLTDNLMIGQLGEFTVAGVGFAVKLIILYHVTLYGACSGIGVFITQFYGKKQIGSLQQLMMLMLVISGLITLPFMLIGLYYPEDFITLFSKTPEVIEIGADYLWIVSLSLPFSTLAFLYLFALRSIGKTKEGFYVTLVSVILNIILNTVLIFGYGPFPALGSNGSAIATTIATCVEAVIAIWIIRRYYPELRLRLSALKATEYNLREVLTMSGIILFSEITWIGALTIVSWIITHDNLAHAVSMQIADNLFSFSMPILIGLASATSIIVAKNLGNNQLEKAVTASRYLVRLSVIGGGIAFCVGVVSAYTLPLIYKVQPEFKELAFYAILMHGLILPVRIVAATISVGVLRAGGDTVMAFVLEVGLIYVIHIPLTYYTIQHYELLHALMGILLGDGIILAALYAQYKRYKWKRNLTL